MDTAALDDTERFFQTIFNDNTKGYLCVAVGSGPYRDESGSYRHHKWEERAYSWPSSRAKALGHIAAAREAGDVYVCPYPMKGRSRSKGTAAQRILIHADVDRNDLDEAKVAELGGFVVWSGTPGHGHVYVPLAWPVTPAQHEALCRGLAATLGGDAKYSDNDLLRPPATFNYKSAVGGAKPSPVTALWCGNGRVDPRDIAPLIGVDLANPGVGAFVPRPRAAERPEVAIDLELYPEVREALEARTGDRSADTFRVVAACRAAGLTLAETTWAVSTREDLRERLADRADDDLLAIWAKIDAEEHTDDEALYTPSNSRAYPHSHSSSTAPTYAGMRRILDRVAKEVRRRGLVGEERLAQVLYLTLTARLLDKQVSAGVKGHSASGKSYTVETVLQFFPPEAYLVFTAMSQRALVFSSEQYAHRTIVLYELTAMREGVKDDLTSYFVRSLLSEGRIEYPVTVRGKDGCFTTKTIVKEGPTNMIFTTTKTRVHDENETRILSLSTNDSREQTARVLGQLAKETAVRGDLDKWHELQRWLADAEHRVTVPYAADLVAAIPPVAVRLRRDVGALLALVRAHAVLHQASRDRDDDGRIIASVDDYAVVRELVAETIAEGVGATVSAVVRETVETVARLTGTEEDDADEDGVPVGALTGKATSGALVREVAAELGLDQSNVARRLRVAADGGYVRNLEDKRGKPGRWVLDGPLPGATSLLPKPEDLPAPSSQ